MVVTLKNTSAAAAIDTHGAELRSFMDGFGTEYMWQADPQYWGKTSPVLFPVVGNLRSDKTTIGGTEYTIGKHGFARDQEFRLVYQTNEKAIFSLMANAQTKAQFPFSFNLQITYELKGCDLSIRYDVYNMSESVMPFCLGAHPAFNVPIGYGVDGTVEPFENYHLYFSEEETVPSPAYNLKTLEWEPNDRKPMVQGKDLPLKHELFDGDALLLDQPNSRQVTLRSILTGRGVQVDFAGFDMVAFWTPAGKQAPFVCIEPWCGAAVFSDEGDEFEKKRGVQFVEPDEKKTYSMTIGML